MSLAETYAKLSMGSEAHQKMLKKNIDVVILTLNQAYDKDPDMTSYVFHQVLSERLVSEIEKAGFDVEYLNLKGYPWATRISWPGKHRN